MANIITAGNSTNGGTAISTDTSGTLNIVTGSGSGANAITIDASQNVTFANAISVAGSTTVTGALSVTGTITASGGVSGSITSGTAVASTSGTSITFTGIPSTAKRVTVLLAGISTNGTSNFLIQIGDSGGIETTGYASGFGTNRNTEFTSTAGFMIALNGSASLSYTGVVPIHLYTTNSWVTSGVISRSDGFLNGFGGTKTLSDTLTQVRITTVNGTDTFDAGTINIFWE